MANSIEPLNQPHESATVDPTRCPLCGGVNDCQLCTAASYKGPCWCESVSIPPELLVRVPVEARNRACICCACVTTFHREQSAAESCSRRREEADAGTDLRVEDCPTVPPPHVGGYKGSGRQADMKAMPVIPGDFYFDANGLMVFTAAYHQRRGCCCGNDCRHCPYEEEK